MSEFKVGDAVVLRTTLSARGGYVVELMPSGKVRVRSGPDSFFVTDAWRLQRHPLPHRILSKGVK